VLESASAWPYLACHADDTPPAVNACLVVDGVRHAHTQVNWPGRAWFKGSFFSGDTQPADSTHEQAVQLDLLAIALRQSLETLIQFFRLNPNMAPRLLAIANSRVGGLRSATATRSNGRSGTSPHPRGKSLPMRAESRSPTSRTVCVSPEPSSRVRALAPGDEATAGSPATTSSTQIPSTGRNPLEGADDRPARSDRRYMAPLAARPVLPDRQHEDPSGRHLRCNGAWNISAYRRAASLAAAYGDARGAVNRSPGLPKSRPGR
jgi:hypothetical protein